MTAQPKYFSSAELTQDKDEAISLSRIVEENVKAVKTANCPDCGKEIEVFVDEDSVFTVCVCGYCDSRLINAK